MPRQISILTGEFISRNSENCIAIWRFSFAKNKITDFEGTLLLYIYWVMMSEKDVKSHFERHHGFNCELFGRPIVPIF
jgi:hypothetical protein